MNRRLLLVPWILLSSSAPAPAAPEDPPVVIPFDFESEFDEGRYGQIVGDLIWQRLRRQGGVILPESMEDVRAYCRRAGVAPNPETPLDEMRRVVRDEQAGDVGIWGKIERAPGEATDVYDLWIVVADFSGGTPRVLHRVQTRTKTVSEIPHVHVAEALAALTGRDAAPAPAAPSAPARVQGPNLVRGDFEAGRPGPVGWDPLSTHVQRVAEPGGNQVIRFTMPPAVAETTGVLYYSDYFPVTEGATYRFQCRWRSDGPTVKVFVKGYDQFGTERREVYRSQMNLTGPPGTWNVHTEDFTPRHSQFTPRWGRVMLYAYHPAGTVDWDDVAVTPLAPPAGSSRTPAR